MFMTNVVLRFLSPRTVVRAHCDLPCGVYDPEQAQNRSRKLLQDRREVRRE